MSANANFHVHGESLARHGVVVVSLNYRPGTFGFFSHLALTRETPHHPSGQAFHPDIPRTWDDREVAAFQLPLAQRDRSRRYMSSQEYYKLKVPPIYQTYPIYAPGREPAGYFERLLQREPEIVFDASKLRTKEDWIRAGQLVFEDATEPQPAPPAPLPLPPALQIRVRPRVRPEAVRR